MAKQRGPHQVKGKINNLSYYEQKNIPGGLIRRINEGMSGRLKNDPVFANTRLANAFFGVCSSFAALIISIVTLRWGTLTRGNRQAILTKGLRNLYLTEYSPALKLEWTNIMSIWTDFSYVFNKIVRTPLDKFMSGVPNYISPEGRASFDISLVSDELIKVREFYGVGALEISTLSPCYIGPVKFNIDTEKYDTPSVNLPARPNTIIYNQLNGDLTITLDIEIVSSSPTFAFLSIRPIQTISQDGTYSVMPNKGLLKCISIIDY